MMMYKQKHETTHYYDMNTGTWNEWKLPTPEYVPDYTRIASAAGTLSAFALVTILICRGMGVM